MTSEKRRRQRAGDREPKSQHNSHSGVRVIDDELVNMYDQTQRLWLPIVGSVSSLVLLSTFSL